MTAPARSKLLVMLVAVALILIGSAYLPWGTWLVNHDPTAQPVPQGAEAVQPSSSRQAREGSDRRQPTTAALDAWSVPADQPRALSVEKLGIEARIQRMGLNSDRSLQAPVNIYDAGWYAGSAKPGQVGAMLIDGHTGFGIPALFNELQRLVPGDRLVVEDGAMRQHEYRVVRTEVVDRDDVDMPALLRPAEGTHGLNLITCTGAWDTAAETSRQRVLVYAVAASQ